ncbi:MAG: response regulator [Pseudomonadota bacterium]
MKSAPVKVLFVEDNPGDVRLVHELFMSEFGNQFMLVDAPNLANAIELLGSEMFDAALLDPNLPDADNPKSIEKLREVAPNLPIIVLTGELDETVISPAFVAGADDYLVKGTISGEILSRAIRYSIERKKLSRALDNAHQAARREREWLALEEMAKPSPSSATASSYGEQSVEIIRPDVWDLLVLEYASLIESSVHDRAFRDSNDHSSRIRSAAHRLGSLRAEPRDVVKIHVEAIKRAGRGANPKARVVITEEARLLLIEVMGNLASYYRTYMGPAPFRHRAAEDSSRSENPGRNGR